MCPSHIWYLMLPSEVRPNRGKIDEPRATGKNRSARHMLPTTPSLNDVLSSLASHLHAKTKPWNTKYCNIYSFSCLWFELLYVHSYTFSWLFATDCGVIFLKLLVKYVERETKLGVRWTWWRRPVLSQKQFLEDLSPAWAVSIQLNGLICHHCWNHAKKINVTLIMSIFNYY